MPETSPVGAASGDPTKDFFTAANEQTYAGMSEATLNATHATIAKNLKRVEDALASYTKNPTESQQKNISKYRTLSNDMTRELAIIESVAADKSRVKKQTQEAEQAEATAAAKSGFEAKQHNEALRKVINPETGAPYLTMAEPDLPAKAAALLYERAKVAEGAEARLPSQMALKQQGHENAMAQQNDAQEARSADIEKRHTLAIERADLALQRKSVLAAEARAAKVPGELIDDAEARADAAIRREALRSSELKFAMRNGTAADVEAAKREHLNARAESESAMAELTNLSKQRAAGGTSTATTIDPTLARAVFDREVKARGIDPRSPEARQLAEDIKAGKVR